MDNLYALEYSYNQYDQLGCYTIALFKRKPTYEMLLDWSRRPDAEHIPRGEDALLRLAEVGHVCDPSSGDDWEICEVEVL